ncbi:FAD-dependent monooxygenase [Kribbella sandramycini]|uniref:FAD-dependent monooxygenase n=1 Tax=Kribbella sandramycini TaxID=60450 RepID=A0A7Y4L4D7_9ACTN|nr:NAD(P)/FAD-dependent oxidoreductase [Kribbella sandramycini]MBB6571356.1 kynurenine 3-monooxygenase [Kribbella sandramycini]NOL43241.1 FAD-dependent monooxygenase [Kribbella sandramycini]
MKVAIVGAGLTGSLLACYLARRGLTVTLYERRADPRAGTAERGRSINLAISERGLDALRRIGLDETVMTDALPMKGRMIHPVSGPLDFQQYSAGGDRAINSISRGALNNALLTAAAAADGVSVEFEHRLCELDSAAGQMVFQTPSGKVTATADVVLGADGAGSAVREQLLAEGIVAEDVDFLDYGYKELSIPAVDGDFALDPGALHIWPRGTSMMIALPNPDRSFTCTLFWPAGAFDALTTAGTISAYFAENYPDVLPLAPTLVDDYLNNPVGVLGTVHTLPWQAHGRTALIGDAAHAIVPFYGQGANCAFEDVVELDRCLDDTSGSWARALPLFESRRRHNTEAIAAMALANFIEMRDKVASPAYRLTKQVEHALERLLPGKYVSRYELVSFTTTPYAEVQRRVHRQHQLVRLAAVALGAVVVALLRRRR